MDLPNGMTRKQLAEFRQKLQSIKTGDFGIAINNDDNAFTEDEIEIFREILSNESQWLSYYMSNCPYAKYEIAKLIAYHLCHMKEQQEIGLQERADMISRFKRASTED